MNHKLKTWPKFYKDIVSGLKPFEIRKNDRGFKVGHTLTLEEWDPSTEQYTGNSRVVRITYLLESNQVWGLEDGYCLMAHEFLR